MQICFKKYIQETDLITELYWSLRFVKLTWSLYSILSLFIRSDIWIFMDPRSFWEDLAFLEAAATLSITFRCRSSLLGLCKLKTNYLLSQNFIQNFIIEFNLLQLGRVCSRTSSNSWGSDYFFARLKKLKISPSPQKLNGHFEQKNSACCSELEISGKKLMIFWISLEPILTDLLL